MDTGREETEHRFCWYIRPFSGDLLDQTLPRGVAGWLIGQHVGRCHACQQALASLNDLRRSLRRLATTTVEESLPAERWETIENALPAIDTLKSPP